MNKSQLRRKSATVSPSDARIMAGQVLMSHVNHGRRNLSTPRPRWLWRQVSMDRAEEGTELETSVIKL
jgi:hypothetical protein